MRESIKPYLDIIASFADYLADPESDHEMVLAVEEFFGIRESE
ncbi:DUF7215 family protein [Actinocorallia libanotica]|uniref:Uncharacterized protein n=1 Tax=Actinocorallia libanotica TaxID=46162 RepID=A0ABP4CEE4_9ACTN